MTHLTVLEWFTTGFVLCSIGFFLAGVVQLLSFLEEKGLIKFSQKQEIGLAPEPKTDFITFPVLCTSDSDSVLASLNLPTESEQEYRTAFYRKSEIAGFYPHSEKGKIWVEMKNGSMCITNVRMKDFKQMVES